MKKMFSVLKAKIAAGFAVIVAIMAVYIKILKKRNKDKANKIRSLKQNAEVEAKKREDDIKRSRFDAVQQERAGKVNNTDAINAIDSERGEINESDNFTTINR